MRHITRTPLVSKVLRTICAWGVLVSLLGTLVPHATMAATGAPRILNYQGRLMDSNGTLLGGAGTPYCFKFSLYDSLTVGSGTKLWPSGSPSTMTATVRNGSFSVGVGDTNAGGDALDYNFQDSDTVYLNIEVATRVGGSCSGGDESFETLAPRQRIYSAAYALNSNTVGGYTPAQEATGSQIPVLSNGRLILGGANPFLNATGTNALTLQGGGEPTGDIQFFNSSNRLTSLGNLTLGGEVFASAFKGLTSLAIGTTATSTLQADVTGTSTIQGFINVLGTNSTSTFSGGIAASYLNLTGTTATSTVANGLNLTGGCFAINGSCIESTSLSAANNWSALQTFQNGFISQASSTVAGALTVSGNLTVTGGLVVGNATTTNATTTNMFASALVATGATSTNLFASALTAGSATSSAFYVSGSFRGAGLGACTNPTDKLQWDETTGQFVCGTDSGTFSTTSTDYWLTSKDTDDLTEGSSNLFFTTNRVAGVIAGTTTDALDEGLSNFYWTQGRFNTALLATSSLPHMSVGTATVALSLSGFDPSIYMTNAAWYATTTDGLDEGVTNLYYTDTRVNSFLAASTTIPKTYSNNTFTGNNTFTNATSTTFRTGTLGVGGDYLTDITGSGLQITGGALTLDMTADWTGTLDGYDASQLLANAFSTTSADFWKTQNNFFSTTSAAYYLSQNQGLAFSTTSVDYWKTQNNFFSTTSADAWDATKGRWSTTSSDFWKSITNFFSTTSSDHWLTTKDTDDLTEGVGNLYYTNERVAGVIAGTTTDALDEGNANLYFTNARADARVAAGIAGTTTDALDEGLTNLYWTQDRFNTALLATSSLPHMSVGTATVALSLSGFDPSIYMTNAAWYATTTDGLDEGSTNLYFTNNRVNSFLAASTSVAKTFADNTFSGANIFNGNTTLTNATSTTFRTGTLGVGSDYITDITGAGLLISGGALTLDLNANWTGTLDGYEAADLLASAFSTTSADFWKTQNNFFSTTSAAYYLSQNQGLAFSTTSVDYWKTQNNFFSTTSADAWDATKGRWSTTSSDFWKSITNFFSTTSTDYWLTTKDTDDLTEGVGNLYYTSERVAGVIAGTTTDALDEGNANLYFTDARADARVAAGIAGTTTDALDEGLSNLYWTQDRFNTALLATSSLPHMSVGTATVALSLSGFDPSTYLTTSAWYATTTDGLDEGSSNLYFTNARVNSFLAASTSVAKTFADNTFSGANIFNGNTTLTNATATTFRTSTLGVGSDYLTDITGTGLLNSGGALSVDLNADWTGTLDGYDASQLLANAFSTTSADFWKTQNNFFSTTSTDYWKSITNFFSTTSADSWLTTKDTDDLAEGSNLFFTTDRVAGVISGTSTDALDEGTSNLYFTNARADARVAAGIAATNTDALDEGLTNFYWTQNRFNTALLSTSSLPHMSVGTATVALSLSGFDPSIYMTNAAWYATTTDALDEGSANFYYTDTRVNSFLAASTSVAKTFADNTFSGANIFNGNTTLTNATATTFRTGTLGIGNDYVTDITGDGLQILSGALTLNTGGNWTGTLDGYEAADFLAAAFSTTSADYWKSQNNFFSTTSAAYYLSQNQGLAFSTTSATHFLSQNQGLAFSTTSADAWDATKGRWSTTSSDFWKSITNFFSTTSTDYWLTSKDTDDLTEGVGNLYYTSERVAGVIAGTTTDALDEGSSNLYFTNARADARVAAGIAATNTDALDEGLTNFYWTQNRFNTALLATSSLPHMSVGTATVALSLSGFDPSIYMTNAAWYATTTDGLDEGSTNLYFTNNRVNSFLAASTSVAKTFADNTFSGANIFNGNTTLTNATATTFRTSTLGVGSDYLTDITGTGLLNSGGALSVDLNADWTGTLDGYEAADLLANAFSTTSADYWKTRNDFFSTTSATYFLSLSQNQGLAFSTTSADAWDATKSRWATTSSNAWLATKSTNDISEGSNLYFTNTRVNDFLAASTSVAKTFANNTFAGSNTFTGGTIFGNTTSTNATSTTFRTGTLGVGSDYITDITGAGLLISGGALTVDGTTLTNVDAATLDSLDSTAFLRSDTDDSASGLITLNGGFLATASSTINGNATTTGMMGVGSLFINSEHFTDLTGTGLQITAGALTIATTSFSGVGSGFNADLLDGLSSSYFINNSFSTTSANLWKSQNNFFSTTSSDMWLTTKTTDDLTEGSTNHYYSDDLANAFVGASSTVVKTYADNTFSGTNIFNGNTTLTNATATTFRTGTLGVGNDYITDITGAGLIISSGALAIDGSVLSGVNADTFDTLDSSQFLRSDTAATASGLMTLNGGFLATASSTINGNATTTGMMGVGSLFMNSERFTDLTGTGLQNASGVLTVATSTFSGAGSLFDADLLDGQDGAYYLANAFSTTSADIWKSLSNFFATTSADHWLTTQTADDLADGSANHFYNDNLVNTFINGSSTIPKTYTNNTFTGNNIFAHATATSFQTNTLGIGADYLTDVTGTGLSIVSGVLSVATSTFSGVGSRFDADLLDGQDGLYYLANGFSTTSAQHFVHSSTTIPKTYAANTWSALQQFTNASSSLLSIFDRLFVGGTATSTIQGNTTGTSTLQGFLNVTGTNSTSTFAGNVQVDGALKVGTASILLQGTATSTFSHGIESSALNITGTAASSTFANGINLSGGCFAINGTCIEGGTGGGGSGVLIAIQTFTSDGTYTPSAGATNAQVIVTGGGGGGGGAYGTDNANETIASGGGGGGTSIEVIDLTGVTSVAVTVGTAGTAGANTGGNGGTGGTSSFGAYVSATGGVGGGGVSANLAGCLGAGGIGTPGTAGAGSGGDINISGGSGNIGSCYAEFTNGGEGGSSYWGGGGAGALDTAAGGAVAGGAAVAYGAGGGGAAEEDAVTVGAAGGAGAGGVVVVYEYGPYTGTMSVANGGTGITSAPMFGEMLVGDGSGGYILAATSTLNIFSEGLTNDFIHASSTIAKTYTPNVFTALQTFTNASSTAFSSLYASSTEGFFGSATAGSITTDNLSIGSLGGFLKATAGAVATSLVDLTTDVTGSIPVENGGTGQSSYNPGDMLFADALGNLTKLAVGGAGQVLKVSGGGLPSWGLDIGGGSGGGGDSVWATTTDELLIYPQDPTDVVVIGNNATTAPGYVLEVDGSTMIDRGTLTVRSSTDRVGIGTTTPTATLTVDGETHLVGDTTLTRATTTGFAITGTSDALLMANANGSVVESTIDPTLSFTGGTLALDLSNNNIWTGLQQFGNASTTLFESITMFARTIQSTSTNALVLQTSLSSTAGLTLGSTSTPQTMAIDSLNNRVTIGTGGSSPVLFVLDTKNTESDPTGVDGAEYYNSNTSEYRCYSNGAWRTCGGIAAGQTNSIQFRGADGSFSGSSSLTWDDTTKQLLAFGNITAAYFTGTSTATSTFGGSVNLAANGASTTCYAIDGVCYVGGPTHGRRITYMNDFMQETGTTATNGGNTGIIEVNSGTGAVTTNRNATALDDTSHPGVARSYTGTTNTGRAVLRSPVASLGFGTATSTYEVVFNPLLLSNATQRYQLELGFFDVAGVNQADGVFFLYDEGGVTTGSTASPNWQCGTAANNTRTFTTTNTAVVAATWTRLTIVVNAPGTRADYYVNGAHICSITTNIPTGIARATGYGTLVQKSAGTTGTNVDFDYVFFEQQFVSDR